MSFLAENLTLALRRNDTGEFYELVVNLGGAHFPVAVLKAPDVDAAIREAKAASDEAAAAAAPPPATEPPIQYQQTASTAPAPPAEPPAPETATAPEPPAAEPAAEPAPPPA